METSNPQTVNEYIALASPNAKEYLERLRIAIIEAAPDMQESISYEMPVYKQHSVVVCFGGYSLHQTEKSKV